MSSPATPGPPTSEGDASRIMVYNTTPGVLGPELGFKQADSERTKFTVDPSNKMGNASSAQKIPFPWVIIATSHLTHFTREPDQDSGPPLCKFLRPIDRHDQAVSDAINTISATDSSKNGKKPPPYSVLLMPATVLHPMAVITLSKSIAKLLVLGQTVELSVKDMCGDYGLPQDRTILSMVGYPEYPDKAASSATMTSSARPRRRRCCTTTVGDLIGDLASRNDDPMVNAQDLDDELKSRHAVTVDLASTSVDMSSLLVHPGKLFSFPLQYRDKTRRSLYSAAGIHVRIPPTNGNVMITLRPNPNRQKEPSLPPRAAQTTRLRGHFLHLRLPRPV